MLGMGQKKTVSNHLKFKFARTSEVDTAQEGLQNSRLTNVEK